MRRRRDQIAPILSYKDLPHEAPHGLEEVWIAYKASARQVGIRKSRRPWPDNKFWKRLPDVSDYTYKPCSRAQAMRITHPPFIGTDKAHCCAKKCIIETLEAHRNLVGHFGMTDSNQIIGILCENCDNNIHMCCSNQLKVMSMSDIEADDFKFYCPDCAATPTDAEQ